jgi:hypothetical protein
MATKQLRVLLLVLAVLVVGLVAQRLHLFGSASSETKPPLSARDARSAELELRKATVAPSFGPEPCSSAPVCFRSKRPLNPMSRAGAVALVKGFLPLTNLTPLSCDAPAPRFRGRHLFAASTSCLGVGSLGRFVAFFAVRSMNSDCRRYASLVGTHITLSVLRVGQPADVVNSAAMREMRALDAQASALARRVLYRELPSTESCRSSRSSAPY